jgi:protein-S-isoprenylcysteine O-methyltransferase Ste14
MPLFHNDIWRQQIGATLLYWGLLPTLVLGPGLVLDRLLGLQRLPYSPWLIAISLIVLAAGLGLVCWSTRDLQKFGAGTPSPLRPAKRLIMEGSYRLCRHPMFLGYDLMLLAAILLLRSPTALAASYPLFLVWSLLLLRKEERGLALRFTDDYRRYQQEVPFLLPRIRRTIS